MLVHSILKELEPFQNITIRNDARIDQILLERDGLTFSKVQLANGEDFSAELLVSYDSYFIKHFYAPLFQQTYQFTMCFSIEFGYIQLPEKYYRA